MRAEPSRSARVDVQVGPREGTMKGPMPPQGQSTRLAIVEQSLADTLARLSELPPGPRVRELRARAEGFERALRSWAAMPPTEEQRAALLKLVLDLNVEAMGVGK